MPQTATVPHPSHWVSYGPPNTQGGAGDWVRNRQSEQKHTAPGGVVLCKRGTTQLHPEATRYAREAWVIYGRYIAAINPELTTKWTPQPVTIPGGTVEWKRHSGHYVPDSQQGPGGWYLVNVSDKEHPHVSGQSAHYAEVEWAKLAKTHAGTGVDNLRARDCGKVAQPVWMPELPVLTEADVRNANKYTRRAVTTKADRIAAEKIIKRPVARAS